MPDYRSRVGNRTTFGPFTDEGNMWEDIERFKVVVPLRLPPGYVLVQVKDKADG